MNKYLLKARNFFSGKKGFSLVELSVVISVAAAATVGFLSWTQPVTSTNAKKSIETRVKMQAIEKAIDNFRVFKKRLPCPSDPLMRNDNSRVAVGTNYNAPTSGSDLYVNDFGVEDLYNTINTGIITPGVNCPVSVGAVPVFSLGLDESYAEDAWGRRFTYQVSPALCGDDGRATSAIAAAAGVGCTEKDYQTKTGNLTVSTVGTTTAAYVLVSHGANGKGAFLPSGVKLANSADANELENSDGNTTYAKPAQSATFDDVVVFGTKRKVESLTNQKNAKHISVEDCEANSTAFRSVTLTENGFMKSNLTTYQQNSGGQNTGDQALLGVMKATQDICISYYGADAATINGKTWSGAQCPGTLNVAAGSTYDAATNSCSCASGLWDGDCIAVSGGGGGGGGVPTVGLQLWLDANDNTTTLITDCNGASATNGQAIACWKDKSVNGKNAVAGNAPTYTTNALNSTMPVIRFNGTANYLSIPSFALGSNMTVFFAGKITGIGGNSLFIEQSVDVNNNNGFYIYGGGGGAYYIKNTGQTTNVNNTNWIGTSPVIAALTHDSAIGAYLYKNGIQISTSAAIANNSTITDTLYIGSRAGTGIFTNGDMAEILIYNTALSDTDRENIESYLSTKWGVTLP